MDGNQVLHLSLSMAEVSDREEFHATVESPLTNVVNPNAKRDRILELEEKVRTEAMSEEKQRAAVQEIAKLEGETGQTRGGLCIC